MNVLFLVKHPGAARNLESILRSLAERGHDVHLGFDAVKTDESLELVRRLSAEHPSITFERTVSLRKGPFANTARALRLVIDYLRYLEPRYAAADELAARAAQQIPAPLRALERISVARRAPVVTRLRRALQALERSLPPSPAAVRLLAERRPDAVLVTPLVGFGSTQAEYVRAAGALGIPTVLPVLSWDNLTNKGLLRDRLDLVLVWNEPQRQEAIELHDASPGSVVVAGAWSYDQWFSWQPSRSREEFAALVGLRPDRKLLLYVCSSPFIAPDEVTFVRRWLGAVRAAGGELAEAGVVVRPHPQHAAQWQGVELGEAAVVWPRAGEDPLDASAKRNYFDSIHHADALVGVNTSALVEAAILGKPVHTVADGTFSGTQEGTLHFHHLAGSEGHLHVAASLGEHATRLAGSLHAGVADAGSVRFVQTFIRPHGLESPATPIAVDAIERVAEGNPTPLRAPALAPVARLALRPVEAGLRRRRRSRSAGKRDELDAAADAVRALARNDRPVVAGPWLAEVGYELLYWLPFLRAAVAKTPGLAGRLTVVSRGGTAPWYDGLASGYVEIFDHVAPDKLEHELAAVGHETGGYRKQYVETALDRRLLDEIRALPGLGDALVLHPATMFAAYRRLAKRRISPLDRPDLFAYAPLPQPPASPELVSRLPAEFIAVRLYQNASFPPTSENVAASTALVRGLAERAEIVVLDPPVRVDDHAAITVDDTRVHRVVDLMGARDNLAVQSAVVARAGAFVGTYGGFSYLPIALGVPSIAVYSDEGRFRSRHLELALRLAALPGFGSFTARHVAEVDPDTVLERRAGAALLPGRASTL